MLVRRAVGLACAAAWVAALAAGCLGAPVAGAGDSANGETGGPPHLVDVTSEVGLDFTHGAFRWYVSADTVAMMGGGACWLDADDDGWLDLYLVNNWAEAEHGQLVADGGLPASTLFHNEEGTSFTDVGESSGTSLTVRGMGCLAADLDGDGATDLFVTTARSSVLLWNDGDGTFTPDGGTAGLDVYGWHTTAVAGDVDGDGLLDVFIGGYVDPNSRLPAAAGGFPQTNAPIRDLLFLNRGGDTGGGHTGMFEEVGQSAGLDPDGARYALGAGFVDVDGDRDLDLIVANDTDPNRLYRNDSRVGGLRLVDVAVQASADDDNSGMGVATGDLDGDGAQDLLVTNMGEQRHTLLTNTSGSSNDGSSDGTVAFRDDRDALGVSALGEGWTGWGASLTDLDGDTHLDVILANGAIPILDLTVAAQPMVAYRFDQGGSGGFVDGTAALGLSDVAPINGRGSAVADYDNDGDPDVAVVDVGGPARLLQTQGQGRWLVVDPEGRQPGTVVTVELSSGAHMVRTLKAGSSYLSTEDPRALFGLGDQQIEQVSVRWPDGAVGGVSDVPSDPVLRVGRPE